MKHKSIIICALLLFTTLAWAQLTVYGTIRTGDARVWNDSVVVNFSGTPLQIPTREWGGPPNVESVFQFNWLEWPTGLTMYYVINNTYRVAYLIEPIDSNVAYGLEAPFPTGSEVIYALTPPGINEIGNKARGYQNLIILPNPAKDRIVISVPANIGTDFELKIYSTVGKLIKVFNRETGSQTIVWNGTDKTGNKIPNGVYIVSLKTNSGNSYQGKLIVRK